MNIHNDNHQNTSFVIFFFNVVRYTSVISIRDDRNDQSTWFMYFLRMKIKKISTTTNYSDSVRFLSNRL